VNQKTATKQAAKLAGFDHCELLQEPIAASMAYGLSSDQKNGYWMVFDFGGGTFDAALLKVEDGIMQVFDTEGDNFLGGKNLDYAIVDDIIIPYLKENYSVEGILADERRKEVLRDAMKTYAEDLKNKLSFQEQEDIISNLGELGEDEDGDEIELDLTVTQKQAFDAMRPYFQTAVDICKVLLERNRMRGSQLNKIIMVGGPTHSPLIRQMLRDQITENVDTSIDPMIAVASGAALYASTIDADVKDSDVEIGTIRLSVGYESTSVELSEWVSVQLDKTATGANCPNKVFVELISSDKTWSSAKTEIDENGNVIEANLQEGKANSFSIIAYDELGTKLECFPFEIQQKIQVSKMEPHSPIMLLGIEMWDEGKRN
jgi:molecular chaperone DnaK